MDRPSGYSGNNATQVSAAPDFHTFNKIAAANPGKLIPVTRVFLADGMTPVAAFRKMPDSPYAFLLESVERGEHIARYSYIGSAPDLIFRGRVLPTPSYCLERPSDGPRGTMMEHQGDPLAALEKHVTGRKVATGDGIPPLPPFLGGAVGYLGYDVVRLVEPRLNAHAPEKIGIEGVPDIFIPVYRTVVAFDHVMKTATIVHLADPSRHSQIRATYDEAQAELDKVAASLKKAAAEPLDELRQTPSDRQSEFKSNRTKEDFLQSISKAKEYIAAGDIIQVVLSQRLTCTTQAHPFEVYRSLRTINPSPYMFYLRMGPLHLVGTSPEVMVRVENGNIQVRPIAGTRRRGVDRAEDVRLANELLADPKERAEHVMLVDLGRNDVGRVAVAGSVHVDEQMIIEHYSHVMHIVSNVSGKTAPGKNAFDVFRACMPAGTVSGAPKIRAMEIIDELEPDRRGAYAGAVGVADFQGNLNTAIAIRTFVMREHKEGGVTRYDAHVQAGAGIVADSVPELEYEETLNKARGLLRALAAAENRLGLV